MTHAHHDTHTSEGERLNQASSALATPTDHGTHADHHGAGHGGHHGGGHMGHGGHGDHAAQFRDRFWWSLLLALPVVGFSSMFADLLGYTLPAGTGWVSPVLGTVVFLYGGWPFLTGAVSELRSRQPGMMLLVAMAITVAFVASALTSLGVGGFDLDFWWELALLVVIMLLGHWLEMRALAQASSALDALAALLPDQADRVRPDGEIEAVSLDELTPGDVVLVRSGARVPADGIVTDGEAEVDESVITGESRPVSKTPGDRVVAGTVATDSALRVRVDAVGEGTALAGIRRLVEQAQASRSRAQALADRAAALLFYFASIAGLITFVTWLALGSPTDAVERTVTVLVIACPHALGLAIPLVIALSTGLSARAGILIKDRIALERMRTVNAVLFDKTGTLTKGQPAVIPSTTPTPAASGCSRWPGRSRPTPSTPLPGPSSPPPSTPEPPPWRVTSARSPAGECRPSSTARRSPSGARPCCARPAPRCPPSWPSARGRGRTGVLWCSTWWPTARSSVLSLWPTRSGPSPRPPSMRCTLRASTSL
jgi:P-type Cu2+ transporter